MVRSNCLLRLAALLFTICVAQSTQAGSSCAGQPWTVRVGNDGSIFLQETRMPSASELTEKLQNFEAGECVYFLIGDGVKWASIQEIMVPLGAAGSFKTDLIYSMDSKSKDYPVVNWISENDYEAR